MSENRNIYITFPRGDALNGWINDFLIHFKTSLQRITDNTTTTAIKEKDFSEENYSEFLEKAACFIIILGTTMENESGYQKEIEEIYNHLSQIENGGTELSRIFKICLQPEKPMINLEDFHSIESYNFFETKSRLSSASEPFNFQVDSEKAWAKLLDLTYDINDFLHQIPENVKESACVYLSKTSSDQEFNRDNIKRELQHLGYRVLPLLHLPGGQEGIDRVVTESLTNCKHVIQVLGAKYGKISPGEKHSHLEMENNSIRGFLSENKSVRRTIWIPADMPVHDQKQNLYINRIKRDESDSQSEIVEANLEEFKGILSLQLNGENEISDHGLLKKGNIYCISHPTKSSGDIERLAEKLDVRLVLNTFSDSDNFYQNHLSNLKQAEYVLINYQDAGIEWLSSNLKDLIKAIGFGRTSPYLSIGIITEEMPEIIELETWFPNVQHLKPEDPGSIEEFLNFAKA